MPSLHYLSPFVHLAMYICTGVCNVIAKTRPPNWWMKTPTLVLKKFNKGSKLHREEATAILETSLS